MIKNFKNLLFENIGIKQTIFKNTFWLVFTQIIISLLGLVLIVCAARILGAGEYGKFAYALSFVSLIASFTDLGISNITTRELAKENKKEKIFVAIFSLRVFLSICAFVLIFIGSFFVTNRIFIRKIIWILGGFIFVDGFYQIIYAFFRSRQKMEYESIIHISQILMIVVFGILILFFIPSAINLSYAYFIGGTVVLIITLFYFNFFISPLRWSFDKKIWKEFLNVSWPLIFGFAVGWICLNIDSTMIGFFGKAYQVGWFSVAARIVAVIIAIGGLIARSFYPALSKFFKESKEKLQWTWNYYMKIMIFLSPPLMVGGAFFSSRIIDLFYGLKDYAPSVFVLQVLMFLIGVTFLSYPYSMILIVCGHQRKIFFIILTGIIINIILNLILFPYYTIYGVVIATAIVSIIVFLLVFILSVRLMPISPFNKELLKFSFISIFSVFITFIALKQIEGFFYGSIIFLIPLWIIIYSVFFLATTYLLKKTSSIYMNLYE